MRRGLGKYAVFCCTMRNGFVGHAQAQDDTRDDNQLTIAVGAAAIPSYMTGLTTQSSLPARSVRGKVSGRLLLPRHQPLFQPHQDKPPLPVLMSASAR